MVLKTLTYSRSCETYVKTYYIKKKHTQNKIRTRENPSIKNRGHDLVDADLFLKVPERKKLVWGTAVIRCLIAVHSNNKDVAEKEKGNSN